MYADHGRIGTDIPFMAVITKDDRPHPSHRRHCFLSNVCWGPRVERGGKDTERYVLKLIHVRRNKRTALLNLNFGGAPERGIKVAVYVMNIR